MPINDREPDHSNSFPSEPEDGPPTVNYSGFHSRGEEPETVRNSGFQEKKEPGKKKEDNGTNDVFQTVTGELRTRSGVIRAIRASDIPGVTPETPEYDDLNLPIPDLPDALSGIYHLRAPSIPGSIETPIESATDTPRTLPIGICKRRMFFGIKTRLLAFQETATRLSDAKYALVRTCRKALFEEIIEPLLKQIPETERLSLREELEKALFHTRWYNPANVENMIDDTREILGIRESETQGLLDT